MMKNKTKPSTKTKEIMRGLEMAYEKVVAFKKYKGTPLVVTNEKGEVIEIPAEEIPPTARYLAGEEKEQEK